MLTKIILLKNIRLQLSNAVPTIPQRFFNQILSQVEFWSVSPYFGLHIIYEGMLPKLTKIQLEIAFDYLTT